MPAESVQKRSNPPVSSLQPPTSIKEAISFSAVTLGAIASIGQLFIGTLTGSLFYGFSGYASYAGYEATKKLSYHKKKEGYYSVLQENAEDLKQECLSLRQESSLFRLENKTLAQNNQNLQKQIESLQSKLKSLEMLLAKIDSSATLTKELLLSCTEVSSDQKKTEQRIQGLLEKLEKTSLGASQKEIEKYAKQLEGTLASMEKQIKQFFLHDAKASELLKIKQEFAHTSTDLEQVKKELEKVQKELSETSARLDKTSLEIESKLQKLNDQEAKMVPVKQLASLIVKILQKKEIKACLSAEEMETAAALQKNYGSLF